MEKIATIHVLQHGQKRPDLESGFLPSPSWEAGDCSHLPPMADRVVSDSYWPLLQGTNIDDDVTHSVLVPYIHKTRCDFSNTLAADALAPHGARSLVETRMTISFYPFSWHFNWQSVILFNFMGPEKSHLNAVQIFRNLAALRISVSVEPHQIHISVDSNVNDQLQP